MKEWMKERGRNVLTSAWSAFPALITIIIAQIIFRHLGFSNDFTLFMSGWLGGAASADFHNSAKRNGK